jgi:hypothetical protein
MKIKAILNFAVCTMLIVLIIGIFCWIFIQSIIGFAGGLVALPF